MYTSAAFRRMRPAAVTAAFHGAIACGVLTIIGGGLQVVLAKYLAETALDVEVYDDLGRPPADSVVDRAAAVLQWRGIAAVVLGALVIAVSFTVRRAALWGRIATAVALAGTVAANVVEFTGTSSEITLGLGVAAALLGLVVIAMSFLPATNRYAANRRARFG